MNIFMIVFSLGIAAKVISGPIKQSEISNEENEIEGTRSQVEENLGEPLNEIDFYNAKLLDIDALNAKMTYNEKGDPILTAGLFEGDIDRIEKDKNMSSTVSGRNAIINMNVRWTDGKVPYTISADFNSFERSVIARAMSEYHDKTCIQFQPRNGDADYIYIMKGNGCSSAVGRQGGSQQVSLGNGCVYFGIVIHELMHAVGFWHEQSRADRDDFIQIVWNNIQRGMEYNFQKYSWKYIQDLGEKYDLSSVMHYEAFAFAADRSRPTIIAKITRSGKMGQRNGFSTVDVRKINTLYKCSASGGEENVVVKPSVITTKEECSDSHPRCSEWATKGECVENPEWMKINCLLSCKICAMKSCEDLNDQCSMWASIGECVKNPSYMHLKCKKSCSTC